MIEHKPTPTPEVNFIVGILALLIGGVALIHILATIFL